MEIIELKIKLLKFDSKLTEYYYYNVNDSISVSFIILNNINKKKEKKLK